jgi:chemotaxis receptor (MCP) glutamine deamidase CheD/HPt (histidine-containing phosphotransfer) domain-containing protein
MNTELFDKLKDLGNKIATELVFAEPGRDLGLLPVNSLLGQIEELAGQEASAGPLVPATNVARRLVNAIFDSTGVFSLREIKRLGEWAEWWQAAISALEAQKPPPPIPADWQEAEGKPAETGSPASGKEEPPLMLNREQDGELLTEFINESREHLQNIEDGVLVLEQHPADADTLNSIFRAFHTFKGGSGFLNLTAIQTLAHELESLLDKARLRKLAITPSVINLILDGGDTLKLFCNEIAAQLAGNKPPGPIRVPTLGLLERVRSVLAGEPVPASATTASVTTPAQPTLPFPGARRLSPHRPFREPQRPGPAAALSAAQHLPKEPRLAMPSPSIAAVMNMDRKVVVGVGGMAVSNDQNIILTTYSLGSCLGITIYDPVCRAGGLLHAMLPDSTINAAKAAERPAMFVDTGIGALLRAIHALKAVNSQMQICVAGGAQFLDKSGFFNIGHRNYDCLIKLLGQQGLSIDDRHRGRWREQARG